MPVRHRLLRLLRLLVTLATLFSAQPSVAARAVDPIALVATTAMVQEPSEETDEADEERRPAAREAACAVSTSAAPTTLRALQSTRALRQRLYLEHCALLR